MLERLYIQNFAVIDELSLEFARGLTVLTGETGAGKSIIVDAVSLLVGAKAQSEMVRSGSERALVQGVFSGCDQIVQALLTEQGIDYEDELIITRDIGLVRSTCRVNGQNVTAGFLRQLGALLIDIHGQHEHQSLFSPSSHGLLIDKFAGQKALDLLSQLADEVRSVERCELALNSDPQDENERVRLLDLLSYQMKEIDAARLQSGEEDVLRDERQSLLAGGRLRSAVERSYNDLSGSAARGRSQDDVLGRVAADLREAGRFSSAVNSVAEELQQASLLVQDAMRELLRLRDTLEVDDARLESIEQRLELISKLKRKYGGTVSAVLAFREEAGRSYERLAHGAERLAQLTKEKAAYLERYYRLAAELTQIRRQCSVNLCDLTQAHLRELGMTNARLKVGFSSPRTTVNLRGAENMELLFSANVDEEPKALTKIASGGEISRVMLALKAVLSRFDTITTLVFDEIDSGVGGKAAAVVAEKIYAVASQKQVLCVSHLAQIAAQAENHIYVHKEVCDGRTKVFAKALQGEARVRELARMLGGTDSPAAMEHAGELLRRS